MATRRLRRAPGTLSRIVGDDLYLTAPHRPAFDVLTGSATTIWMALDAAPTLEELIDTLARAHGTPGSTIEPDVVRFVAELRGRGWLVDQV